jgi:hypothetical protein
MSLLGMGVAGLALDRAIPLGRVWSFPKKIVVANTGVLGRAFGFDWSDEVNVGSLTPIRIPALFEIGDVITFADWPGRFVVSRIIPDERVELFSAEQRLVIRGAEIAKLTPAPRLELHQSSS